MKYLHTMVRIHNIEDSLDFYCNKLGLKELTRHDSEAGRYTNIFLYAPQDETSAQTTKAPVLELTYNWPDQNGVVEKYTGGRNFGHLAFAVENIYEACQKLMDAGVTINRPLRDGHMAFIKSPDGISVEFLQANGSLPPREPWISMPNTGTW